MGEWLLMMGEWLLVMGELIMCDGLKIDRKRSRPKRAT